MQRGKVVLTCTGHRVDGYNVVACVKARQGEHDLKSDEYAQLVAACYIISTISKLKHKERVFAGHGHGGRRIYIEGQHRRAGKYNDACKGYVVGYEGQHGFYIGPASGAFETLMQEANINTPELLKPYGIEPLNRGWCNG